MAETDEEQGWIQKSQRGDHEAFACLVRRHQQMIHALTFRMTGSLADSEDLAQETILSAYRNLAGYRFEARFSSWLYRVAMNQCLNWLGRQKRQGELAERWRVEQGGRMSRTGGTCGWFRRRCSSWTPNSAPPSCSPFMTG